MSVCDKIIKCNNFVKSHVYNKQDPYNTSDFVNYNFVNCIVNFKFIKNNDLIKYNINI